MFAESVTLVWTDIGRRTGLHDLACSKSQIMGGQFHCTALHYLVWRNNDLANIGGLFGYFT
jgi:hypothetical protein